MSPSGPAAFTDITEGMTNNIGYRLQIMLSPLGDCTNGGESSRRIWVNVVGRVDGALVEQVPNQLRTYDQGPLFAVKRVGGQDALVPVDPFDDCFMARSKTGMVGPVSGGNVAIADANGDTLFVQWLIGSNSKIGVFLKIHDRFETQAAYDAISR